jgi:hypothetical protein
LISKTSVLVRAAKGSSLNSSTARSVVPSSASSAPMIRIVVYAKNTGC